MWLLVRLARWARHPPSPARARLILGVFVICLLLVVLERLVGLPDWASLDPRGARWPLR
ncbi:hypothetical protein [Poseidonocella sedimentorum]|uniref:Uncharacterized protein n=1 Tax=Poseidonocella sedimentorum TaxID=871652 RepID=A0A1I6E9I3_9RHOB|nr:hypothetical protein [Poseidonocella sedimentorum]SFR14221.1 hypothetical protein SAMN04515673_108103 [Poseidonocella sedimentorum]